MACDSCNCDNHLNKPCPTCLNCVGHYTHDADWDEVHYDFTTTLTVLNTKPHYRYNAKTGEITEVSRIVEDNDDNDDVVRQAFGL